MSISYDFSLNKRNDYNNSVFLVSVNSALGWYDVVSTNTTNLIVLFYKSEKGYTLKLKLLLQPQTYAHIHTNKQTNADNVINSQLTLHAFQIAILVIQ